MRKPDLNAAEIDRVIQMAWEDRTPFEAIYFQYGLREKEVIALMKREMTLKNWKKWRARVQGRKTKHAQLRNEEVNRFRSEAQRPISQNRISKK